MSTDYGTHEIIETDDHLEINSRSKLMCVQIPYDEWRLMVADWAEADWDALAAGREAERKLP